MRQHRPGEGFRVHQGGFQVNVGVDKARRDDLAAHVHLFDTLVFAHAHYQAFRHGDIPLAQLVGEHVHIRGVLQHQISLFLAHSHANHMLLLAHLQCDALCTGLACVHPEHTPSLKLVLLLLYL